MFILIRFRMEKLGAVLAHPTTQVGRDAGVELSLPVAKIHEPHDGLLRKKGLNPSGLSLSLWCSCGSTSGVDLGTGKKRFQ